MLINDKWKVAFDFIDDSVPRPKEYEDRIRMADLRSLTLKGIWRQINTRSSQTAFTTAYYEFQKQLSKHEGGLVGGTTWQDMRSAIVQGALLKPRIKAGVELIRRRLCL